MKAPAPAILITGAGGFIGSALSRYFAANGWRVIGAGRRPPETLLDGEEWRPYDLAWTSLPEEFFEGVDAVVHAAVARQNFDLNVAAGTLLLKEAQRAGIERIVFLSSLAAHARARSQYGKQKFALEQLFDAGGALVIRPGLVLGDGGAFASMVDYLRNHRFVPLIGGGTQPIQTVYVGDLVRTIFTAANSGVRGTFTIAEADAVSYRAFYRALGARLGVDVTFVPIPFWAADLAVRAAAMLRVGLPIDRDNLLGLGAMQADRGPRLDPPAGPVGNFTKNIALAVSAKGG